MSKTNKEFKEFFSKREKASPAIYAYELIGVEDKAGMLKVGCTNRDAKTRVSEQLKTSRLRYKIVLEESSMRNDGSEFDDHDVHKVLKKLGVNNPKGEWFECDVDKIKAAILAVKERKEKIDLGRSENFKMRPEQEAAVEKTVAYFKSVKEENPNRIPHFLWNAKMRFGKTFAAYQLAKRMGWTKTLVLTFKPAVQNAWEEDLERHIDFEGWQFVSRNGLLLEDSNKSRPVVCFGSFQDFLGKSETGGIKTKNKLVHSINWDCVILDEYHYGAWRENAKDLFEGEDKKERKWMESEELNKYEEKDMPIRTGAYLYLSGTPFRALDTGEFCEEQIYNWTYSDEQRAKAEWKDKNISNPYASLPQMVLLTYRLPDTIRKIAEEGEFNEFDLNEFFKAERKEDKAVFKHENEVQKWLDLIRGALPETIRDNLKLSKEKPPMPFSNIRLLEALSHTIWFLPNIASCYAMRNLLKRRQNSFYNDYKIITAAGAKAGIGAEALDFVLNKIGDPLKTKSITLSCGKLTTGVSVKPWTGILMLRNCKSPETYFQAAFRVQTSWTIPSSDSPNQEEILKEECYVFDFAPNRALKQISDYSCRLNIDESNPEKKVKEFIEFLPVLAYDGSSMREINAAEVLDMAISGTTASLLARCWQNALFVNVDNDTLQRLLNNPKAIDALNDIEGFRTLNQDIEIIINKSDSVSKLKKKENERELTEEEKKRLTKEEKEYKSKRNDIKEKLIKFVTRIPAFMYLTDNREESLKEVIEGIEPELFKKTTGLYADDFKMLERLGVFNGHLMNEAVYKFRRYEDASLHYAGIYRHKEESVGLFQ